MPDWRLLCFACVFFLYFIFVVLFEIINLKIYWTDLHQILRIGRLKGRFDYPFIQSAIAQETLS